MAWFRNSSAALVAGLCLHGVAAADTMAETLSTRWMAAYNSGDVKALAAIYTADARVQHGYCPAVSGRDAIEAFWTDYVAAGGVQTRLYILDSFEIGELVYLSGRYAVNDPQIDTGTVGGTFTQIWRRGGNAEWSLYRESWVNFACVKVRSESADENAGAIAGTTL